MRNTPRTPHTPLLLTLLLLASALALLPLWAHAQPLPDPTDDLDDDHGPPDGPPHDLDDDHGPPDGHDDPALRAVIRAQIQDARAAAMREHLGLDDATAASLDATLRAHDEAIHTARAAMRSAHKALRDAASQSPPPDDATLEALMLDLANARAAMHAAEWNVHVAVKPLLTTQQRAALMMFLPAFEREVRALIRSARRASSGHKNDRRGPPHPRRRGPHPHP
jgi:Spy/CpxP family protein refolding chaperone